MMKKLLEDSSLFAVDLKYGDAVRALIEQNSIDYAQYDNPDDYIADYAAQTILAAPVRKDNKVIPADSYTAILENYKAFSNAWIRPIVENEGLCNEEYDNAYDSFIRTLSEEDQTALGYFGEEDED